MPRALLRELLSNFQYVFSKANIEVKRKKLMKRQGLSVLIMKQTNHTHALMRNILISICNARFVAALAGKLIC